MSGGPAKRYKGRTTPYVIMTCIVAASGGGQHPVRLLLPALLMPPACCCSLCTARLSTPAPPGSLCLLHGLLNAVASGMYMSGSPGLLQMAVSGLRAASASAWPWRAACPGASLESSLSAPCTTLRSAPVLVHCSP